MTSGEAQTLSKLTKFIDKRRPVLWVGAGLSVPAGYPGIWQLAKDLWDQFAEVDQPDLDDAYQLIDRFHARYKQGNLDQALSTLISPGKSPTASHEAIASLAKAGKFPKLITTNYDDLLETALNNAGAPYVKQVLDSNDHIADDGRLRLMKIHGDMGDWKQAILTGKGYANFGERFGFLVNQLDIEMVQRPILFVGCSMLDERILDWLHLLTDEKAAKIKSWRALLTSAGVAELKKHPHEASGKTAWDLLQKIPFDVVHLPDFETLPKWWTAIAGELAPPDGPQTEWSLHFLANGDMEHWSATFEGRALDLETLPFGDEAFLKVLNQLEQLVHQPLPCGADGKLGSVESQMAVAMEGLAQVVGERLAGILDEQARETLSTAMNANTQTMLRIRAEGPGADRILALPWELLWWDGRFPVKDIRLDLVREVVVPGAPELEAEVGDFKVLVHIAAPEVEDGGGALDYEQEAYRLVLAMEQAAEKEVIFSDLGTVRDLIQALNKVNPTVLHFTGHGQPGELIFENDVCEDVAVKIADLMTQIRAHAPTTKPQLFYLASCHGASQHAKKRGSTGFRQLSELGAVAGEGPSSAVTLQREGCPAVLAYFGPVGDKLSTSAEVDFYAGLKAGKSLCEAIRSARFGMGQTLAGDHGHYRYPLGWAQLSLYLRGADTALCDGKTTGSGHYALEQELFREDHPVQSLKEFREKGRVAGFIGRRKAMALLRKRYGSGTRTFVLHGMGGIGKTTLALEWIAKLGIEPERVVAINAQAAKQSPDPIENLWHQLMGHLESKFPSQWKDTADDTAKALDQAVTLRAFANTMGQPWLIYIDNAESLQMPLEDEDVEDGEGAKGEVGRWASEALAAWWSQLAALAPQGGNLALVATTRYVWPGLRRSERWQVGVLRDADMLRMMRWFPTLRRMQLAHKQTMVDWLNGHARALVYLESLLRHELGDPAPEETVKEARWQKAIDQATKGTEKKLVTEDLMLKKLWQRLDEASRRHLHALTVLRRPAPKQAIAVLGDRTDRLEAMGLLTKFQGEMRGLHAVVHQFVGKQAGKPDLDDHLKIGRWYKAQSEKEASLFCDEEAIFHLMAANTYQEVAMPGTDVARHYRNTLRYSEAQDLLNRIIPHIPAGESLEQLLLQRGNLHKDLGLFAKSEEDFRAMLASTENRSNAEGLKGNALHGLANALNSLGRYAEAVSAYERALAIQKSVYGGETHPEVAASLAGLANARVRLGRYEEAVSAYERSLAIQKAVYGGETHPEVAASLHGLANALGQLGRYEEAVSAYERSLAIQKAVYGREDHPSSLPTSASLAVTLWRLERPDEARVQLNMALKIARAMGHPYHVGNILKLYAGIEEKENPANALRLATEAASELGKVFRADHPTVQNVQALIARLTGEGG